MAKWKPSKRHQALEKGAHGIIMSRATKLKSSFDPSFLVKNLKKWEHLTDFEFDQDTYQMLAILDHKRVQRDHSFEDL